MVSSFGVPRDREVVGGERHCQNARQNKRAAAPDTWGRPRALHLCSLVAMGKVWRGAWSCCLHHLLKVLERMKPDSPKRSAAKGKRQQSRIAIKEIPGLPGGR